MNKFIPFLFISFAVVCYQHGFAQTGVITTIAGNGNADFSGDNGAAVSCELYYPAGVAINAAGDVFISDQNNRRVRKITAATGIINTIAGNGTASVFYNPKGMAIDTAGNVYVASPQHSRIKKIQAADGIVVSVAGNGAAGYSGDGVGPLSTKLNVPTGVAVDIAGNLYIADALNNRVRKVDAVNNIITTIAGNGAAGYNGDNMAATTAELNYPSGVAVDATGNVYIADNSNHRIRKVDVAGNITTVAGTGVAGYNGDGIPAVSAQVYNPFSVAVDVHGHVLVADQNNNRIRMINAAGNLVTVAGNGSGGFGGDGSSATDAQLYFPSAVAVDGVGNLYIADESNNRIRKVANTTAVYDVDNTNVVNIYPNPVQDVLSITSVPQFFDLITINNNLGTVVLQQKLTEATTRVQVNMLPAGIYYVYLLGARLSRVHKFVKM